MKKLFLVISMGVLLLTGCGKSVPTEESATQIEENTNVKTEYTQEEKTELVKNTPMLNLDEVFDVISVNEAKAEVNYNQKMFQVKVSAMNIGTDFFEYAYIDGNITRSIKVFMPTEELAKLDNGDKIIVLGELSVSGTYLALKNAFVVSSDLVEQVEFDEQTIKDIIEQYNPKGEDGNIHWDIGSSPILIDNRLSFEQLDENTFYEAVKDGEWTTKEYISPKDSRKIVFTSSTTADVSTNGGKVYEWEYGFSGDKLKFPVKASDKYEVRRVSDNLIVFYAKTVDYVPYWLLYKE